MRMTVSFFKDESSRTCRWTARVGTGREFEGTTMAAGADIPHDLAQFVVESAFAVPAGFWGLVACGAYFKSVRGRRPTQPGRLMTKAYARELDESERVANDHIGRWKHGKPTEVGAALDAMYARWKALEEGKALTLEWTSPKLGKQNRQHQQQ